jgi:hypothetical protein
MCTVSIVPTRSMVRLVVNRDERRERPPAWPPRLHQVGTRSAIYPIDPSGLGTWVGVNDAGLAVVLLNATAAGRATPGTQSRGLIAPALLASASLEDAVVRAIGLVRGDFSPFRVLVVHRRRLALVRGGRGARPRVEGQTVDGPLVFASSSLGDRLVEPLRRRLFDGLSTMISDPLLAQAQFHCHQWAQRPHLSVMMERQDARTVSRTRIDLGDDTAPAIAYQPIGDTRRQAQEYAWAS